MSATPGVPLPAVRLSPSAGQPNRIGIGRSAYSIGYDGRYGRGCHVALRARAGRAHPGRARRSGGDVPGDHLGVRERLEAALGGDVQQAAGGCGRALACGGGGSGRSRALACRARSRRLDSRRGDHARRGAAGAPLETLALPAALAPRRVTLPEKLVALHRALAAARVPHAFGGAIALAYWTEDPRGTSDIDVNLFVPASDPARALGALPDGVEQPPGTAEAITRDGQIRLWWDGTPVDLFFDYDPVHAEAARHRRTVPFEGLRIPVLGPVELAVFKVMFDRTRDWADVEAMADRGTLDFDAVRATLARMLPDGDARFERLASVERGAD